MSKFDLNTQLLVSLRREVRRGNNAVTVWDSEQLEPARENELEQRRANNSVIPMASKQETGARSYVQRRAERFARETASDKIAKLGGMEQLYQNLSSILQIERKKRYVQVGEFFSGS